MLINLLSYPGMTDYRFKKNAVPNCLVIELHFAAHHADSSFLTGLDMQIKTLITSTIFSTLLIYYFQTFLSFLLANTRKRKKVWFVVSNWVGLC